MSPTLVSIGLLVILNILGSRVLRRVPMAARAAFDVVCFVLISAFLLHAGVGPVFPAPHGLLTQEALWIRFIGGAWWFLGARLFVGLLWFTFHRDARSRETRLFYDLTVGATYIATALVVLSSVFALPITGILATSGVLAIVLGLALQNTLADVFAGIAVGIEAPFSVGDRVRIGDHLEGAVVQVNWRSIHIQTDGDDVAVIPNSVVAKAEIINRSFPTQRRAASIRLSVPMQEAPEDVLDILLQATWLCPGVLQTPPPSSSLASLRSDRAYYSISFFVESTKFLSMQEAELLLKAQRQLRYARLFPRRREPSLRPACNITGLSPRAQLLSAVSLFERLSDEQLNALAEALLPVELSVSATLFEEGAFDATLYVVASGILALSRALDKDALIPIGNLGAGDSIGTLGLLNGVAQRVTAKARTPCLVFALPKSALQPLFAQDPQLVAKFEATARSVSDQLNQHAADHEMAGLGDEGQLAGKIRSFFHLSP